MDSIFDQFISSVEDSITKVVSLDLSIPQVKNGNVEMFDEEKNVD